MLQKFTKRRNLLMTAILLCFCAFTNKAVGQSWSLNNGTLNINDNSAFSSNPYPWSDRLGEITTLNIGSEVTSIPAIAFWSYSNLQNIIIEDGSNTLNFENGASFAYCSIGNFYLGRNISYSNSPFYYNTIITLLTIGNQVTSISANCFSFCTGLTSIIFGSGLTSIGDSAFDGCKNITNALNIPAGVKTIGNYAFSGCESASSLFIPNSVNSIGVDAFSYCVNLQNVTIEDGSNTLDFGNGASPTFEASSIGSLYLGRNISYSNSPFYNNPLVTSLTIGNRVTSISANCFIFCTGLTSIIFGSGLTSIEDSAFDDCKNITNALNIPAGVKTIGNYAFVGCESATSLFIPNSVNSIGVDAFSYCVNLQNITIEDGSNTLDFGNGASPTFEASSIGSLYLGRNISYSNSPFYNNPSVTSLTIGKYVSSIPNETFFNCNGLAQITSNDTTPPTIYSNTFYNVSKSIPIHVPCNNVADYQKAPYWGLFTNYQCPTTVNEIEKIENKIYPNPVKDELFINSESPIKKVEICSLAGALLLSNNSFNGKISVSSLLKGVYLIKVYTDNGLTISKIVKE